MSGIAGIIVVILGFLMINPASPKVYWGMVFVMAGGLAIGVQT